MYILQFFDAVDGIHLSTSSFCHRFREGFTGVYVLKPLEGKSPLAKQYTDTRQDALAEDLPGSGGQLVSEPDNRSAVTTTLHTS